MHPMPQADIMLSAIHALKPRKSLLLGTSALVCLALAAPVMADDFTITSGTTTNDGNTINGGDTVTVTGALTTIEANIGIETTSGTNTVVVSETGSITTTGDRADGIGNADDGIDNDDYNTTTVYGSITTTGDDASGIYNGGDDNITTVSGSIETTGDDSYGIYNKGNNNTTTVSGSITTGVVGTTNGYDATGVWNSGTGNTTTLTSTGVITVRGPFADGIFNDGGTNTTIVHGSISVSGDGTSDYAAEGIHNHDNGNTTTISSTGLITSSGNYNRGIHEYGDNNFINMHGFISLSGDESEGIQIDGDNNTTTVSGSITTTGDDADGIYHGGDDNTTTVSGSITTTGEEASGISNGGDDNITTVSGSIETTGDYGYGIHNKGNNNTTTVSGSITTGVVGTTNGDVATGVWNSGTGNTTTLTSTGVITVRGPIADGINNGGGTSTTIVHGSINVTGHGEGADYTTGVDNRGGNTQTTLSKSSQIITTGNRSVAVYAQENNNITNMHGYISVSGDWSDGISNWGNNNINNISGSISATGTTNSNAILVYSGSGNSFTLDEGAVIIGGITADAAATNNKLKFNLGEGLSYAYSVGGGGAGTGAGQWTFTDQDGRTPIATTTGASCPDSRVTVCNLVTGVSTGNLEAQDELQFSMNSSMIGSLEFGSGQADAPAEAMSFTQSSKSNTWTNVYGGTSKRASSTTKLAFDTSNRGLTIGTPVSINDTLDVDLVFNVSRTSLDIGLTKDQEITSNSYNLGAVLRDLAPSTGWAVDAFGFIGRNFYDGKRKVMNNQEATGSETVTAAYSGSEVLVGVDAQYSNPINDTLNFIGGVNASLSNEKIGAYSESKYYSWDARTMAQASGGITAGLEYHTDALTTFANLGVQGMSQRSGKTATYTNNGTAGSYTNNSRGDIYRTASVGFDYKAEDGLSFTGAIERFSSTGGVSGNSASLTANWSF